MRSPPRGRVFETGPAGADAAAAFVLLLLLRVAGPASSGGVPEGTACAAPPRGCKIWPEPAGADVAAVLLLLLALLSVLPATLPVTRNGALVATAHGSTGCVLPVTGAS